MPFERSLAEVLNAHKDTIKDELRVALPGVIVAVYPDRQTVDVQLAIKNPLHDEFGNTIFEDAQSFSDVPLGVMRGGGFFVWMPVAVGDAVMLLWSDLSMDAWRGAGNLPIEPNWVGKHTADSPVAIPMIAPDASAISDVVGNMDTGKVVIGKDGSPAKIRISASEIDLGATPTSPVALSMGTQATDNAMQTEIQAIATWVAAFASALASSSTYILFQAAMVGPSTALATAIGTTGAAAFTAALATQPATLIKGQ